MAKKREVEIVQCLRCKHATLDRYGNDPVIAHCAFSSYGEVAVKPRTCAHYIAALHTTINQHSKQDGLRI